jgi:hypothetical protein
MMILKFLLPDQRMDTTLAIGSSSTSISAISPSRRFAAAQQLGRFWREADIKMVANTGWFGPERPKSDLPPRRAVDAELIALKAAKQRMHE